MWAFRAIVVVAMALVALMPATSSPYSNFATLPPSSPSNVFVQSHNSTRQPLDPSSAALVATLDGLVAQEEASHSGPYINTTKYSVPVYDVPAGQPLVPVVLNRTQPYAASLKASFAAGVPIPLGAQPAAGRDQHLVIYQPSTDTMWEFWHAQLVSGVWHADWGGTMQRASQNPGYFLPPNSGWGATATSIPLVDGLITPGELASGQINHAVAFAIPGPRARVWAFPAQRTDGGNTSPTAIPEGAEFRLDPALNLASLHLPAATLAIAEAVQRYGMILRDTAGTVTFYAQDPTPTGSNPYPSLFGGLGATKVAAAFPWSHLQLLPMTLK